jgi:hypothetical protein
VLERGRELEEVTMVVMGEERELHFAITARCNELELMNIAEVMSDSYTEKSSHRTLYTA